VTALRCSPWPYLLKEPVGILDIAANCLGELTTTLAGQQIRFHLIGDFRMRPLDTIGPALAACKKNGRPAAVAAVGIGAIVDGVVDELDFERRSAVFT